MVVVVMVVGVVCLSPLDFPSACGAFCSKASWDFKCNAGLTYLAGFVVSKLPRGAVAEPFFGTLFTLFLCAEKYVGGGKGCSKNCEGMHALSRKGMKLWWIRGVECSTGGLHVSSLSPRFRGSTCVCLFVWLRC